MTNPYRIRWIVWRNPGKKCYIKRYIHHKQVNDMQCSPDVLDFVVIDNPNKQEAFSEGYLKLSTSKRKM
jgi:hypothetical protein